MTTLADAADGLLVQNPPFVRAFEALSAIMAQHGRARMAAWARSADDDPTKVVAILLENATLALNLMRDLEDARRSGNTKKLARVRRRLDRLLAALRKSIRRTAQIAARYRKATRRGRRQWVTSYAFQSKRQHGRQLARSTASSGSTSRRSSRTG
jgi:hypothetical protein